MVDVERYPVERYRYVAPDGRVLSEWLVPVGASVYGSGLLGWYRGPWRLEVQKPDGAWLVIGEDEGDRA